MAPFTTPTARGFARRRAHGYLPTQPPQHVVNCQISQFTDSCIHCASSAMRERTTGAAPRSVPYLRRPGIPKLRPPTGAADREPRRSFMHGKRQVDHEWPPVGHSFRFPLPWWRGACFRTSPVRLPGESATWKPAEVRSYAPLGRGYEVASQPRCRHQGRNGMPEPRRRRHLSPREAPRPEAGHLQSRLPRPGRPAAPVDRIRGAHRGDLLSGDSTAEGFLRRHALRARPRRRAETRKKTPPRKA